MRSLLYFVFIIVAIVMVDSTALIGQKKKRKKRRKRNKITQKAQTLPYMDYIKSATEISKIEDRFDRLKYQLIGHFSNKKQVSAGITDEPLQEFIVMPIFQDRPGEFWVYLELFSPLLVETPVDQRIEQYIQVAPDSFRMEVYYLKEPAKYVNAWNKKKFPETSITHDLIRNKDCDLMIAYNPDKPGTYKTAPPKEITCEMLTTKGASRYVDLEFELTDDKYLMWFHFYNRNKKHLKMSEKNGLIFNRVEGVSKHLLDAGTASRE